MPREYVRIRWLVCVACVPTTVPVKEPGRQIIGIGLLTEPLPCQTQNQALGSLPKDLPGWDTAVFKLSVQ
jgi:hypothetical protein